METLPLARRDPPPLSPCARSRYAWMRWSTLAGVIVVSIVTARMPPSWPGLAALFALVGVYIGLVTYQYGTRMVTDCDPLRTRLPWYFFLLLWWKPPSFVRGGHLRIAPVPYLLLCASLVFALMVVPSALGESSYWFSILFFVVAGEASRHLREVRTLTAMVGLCIALVLAADFLLTTSSEWLHDALQWLPLFLGLIASTMGGRFQVQQEEEHAARLAALQELERSKADLEQANRQLQVYAGTVEELAVANERNRLARELHDILGYTLATVVVKAEAAKRLLATDTARAAAELDRVQEIARGGLAEVRRSVSGLRDAAQAPSVWHEVLCKFVEDFGHETHIETACTVEPLPCGHDPELQVTLFRIVQESLTNVARHARAQRVSVRSRVVGDSVELAVQDDGVGMGPGEPSGGFGLRGMRERVTLLGGQLVLSSRRGEGTSVRVTLPLQLAAVDAPEPHVASSPSTESAPRDDVRPLAVGQR